MIPHLATAAFVLFPLSPTLAAAMEEPLSAAEIVARADEIRNPPASYILEATITSHFPDRKPVITRYEVFIKGRDRSLMKMIYPERYLGRVMLMVGDDLWLHLPEVRKPIRLAAHQNLSGEVANGDIARMNFSRDYTARLLPPTSCDGEKCHEVELIRATKSAAYARVLYRIRQEDFHPVSADFYGSSGRLLKRGVYGNYRRALGRLRPLRLTLVDATREGVRSVLEFDHLRYEDLPDRMFHPARILRMR